MVDTDYSGWSEDVALADGSVEQLWRGDRMSALSAAHLKGSLFVSGATSNQGSSNAVVLLSLPVDVHLSGIASRVTNPFGREPAERARILHDLETVEPLLRRTASTEIDTNRPLVDVVDALEALPGGRLVLVQPASTLPIWMCPLAVDRRRSIRQLQANGIRNTDGSRRSQRRK